jgi:hypothetical protein
MTQVRARDSFPWKPKQGEPLGTHPVTGIMLLCKSRFIDHRKTIRTCDSIAFDDLT